MIIISKVISNPKKWYAKKSECVHILKIFDLTQEF
jgi:hypothetical protein